ncbi:MAG: TonB-dependent receptor [Pseudomonadota bacterium]
MKKLSLAKSKWKSTQNALPVLVTSMLLSMIPPAIAADSRKVEFSIPAQRADRALRVFAQQAGFSVLFPFDQVSKATANRVVGAHDVEEGLELLLAGTGLTASIREGDRLSISVEQSVDTQEVENPVADDHARGVFSRALSAITSTLKSSSMPTVENAQESSVARLEEIMITGSRIRQPDFNSAQPTTVLDSEMLVLLGLNNTGDAMTLVPSNLGNWNPTSKPGGNESFPLNVFNGLNLANLRGLNPRYGSRTLTLVDSRRHMPTNQGDGVDLNLIPSILIDRMEVVTGGASASYGSGAIGGVVNVLLDHDLDGLKTEIGFGTTARHDGDDRYYGLAWGDELGDSGHLTLGVELQDMDAIEDCIAERDWCARGAAVRENRNYRTNAEPNFVFQENVRFDMSKRGVFSTLGREFNDAGTGFVPYQMPNELQVGGNGQHLYLDTTLRTNVEREIAYAGYEQQLDADKNFFVETSFGSVSSWTPQDSIDLFAAAISPDNFYLKQLAENPCQNTPQSCFINKDFSAQVTSVNDTQTDLRRFTVGFGDRFGDTTWTWDAYYQFGQAEMLEAVHNSRHALRMQFAMDAVDDGNGRPVCRTTRDGIANFDGDARLADGCVPINIFGTQNISPQAFDYSFGRILENTQVDQDMIEFVTSGELAKGFGAGPVQAAAGVSWRDETLENIADATQPDYMRTDYNSQFGETFGGDVEVTEYFAELEIPVTETFGLQVAGRGSHYENTAGIGTPVQGQKFRYDINTWKVNGNWEINDWLTLRTSQSRDSRAPNFRELYYGKVFAKGSNFGYCDNPWTGNRFRGFYTFTGDPCTAVLRGGIDLKPEKSDTTTFGFVVALPDYKARLSADYFRIEIMDAITPASWSYTIDQCYEERDPEFCSLITGQLLNPADPLGGFSQIDLAGSKSLNQQYYETEGVDLAADWAYVTTIGTFSTRLMASHMIRQLVQPTATSPVLRDIAGVSGSSPGGADWEAGPSWSAQWFTTYARGPFSLTLQARYVSEGIKDAAKTGPHQTGFNIEARNSIDNNQVPDYLIWGFNTSYDFNVFGVNAQLFGNVQNLFDKDPPLIGLGIGGTNPVLFDTVGRRFRIGLRTQF